MMMKKKELDSKAGEPTHVVAGPYSKPRRVPVGPPTTVPVEAKPLTLQEQLQQMVAKELRFRELQRKTGAEGPDDGLDEIDLLGDDDDVMDVEFTPSEVDFLMSQLEVSARTREKLEASKKAREEANKPPVPEPVSTPQPKPKKGGDKPPKEASEDEG